MKYQIVFSAVVGTALAAGAADTVNQVLADINTALKSFDTAIKGYSGGSSQPLIDASNKIQQLTQDGASKISSGSDLTLNDAVSITTNVQSLQSSLDATLSDLEGIGSKLASAGQCGTITSSLDSQVGAAKSLQDAITSKAPAETKSIAQQLGGKIGASLSDTQSKFKTICAGAPSGPSSGSSGSSSGSSGSSGAPSSGGHSGHGSGTGTSGSKTAASSTVPKPAKFTGAASRASPAQILAMGVAAAALAF
jgi:hypothetical protein